MTLPDPEDFPDEVGGNPRVRPHEKVDPDDYAALSDYATDSTADDSDDDELPAEDDGDARDTGAPDDDRQRGDAGAR